MGLGFSGCVAFDVIFNVAAIAFIIWLIVLCIKRGGKK